MLEGLDKINWKSYGAEYIPDLIRGLASPDQKTFGGAYGQLEWILAPWELGADENYDDFEIQKRLEGGIPQLVTPFLIELIQMDGVTYKEWILTFLHDLSFYPQLKLQTEFSQEQARKIFELVLEGMPIYQMLLNDSDPKLKRGAQAVIAQLQTGL
jgi:hypothetical protein